MSADVVVSERDAVLRERLASAKARCAAIHWSISTGAIHTTRALDEQHAGFDSTGVIGNGANPCTECRQKAESRYPLPKVTRPRVVHDPLSFTTTTHWTVEGGCVRRCDSLRSWTEPYNHGKGSSDWAPLPARVKVWADLLGRPTEEVEDAGSVPSEGGE